MSKGTFKFLKQYSSEPFNIDRLLVSAYLELNDRTVKRNALLRSYSIPKLSNEHKHLEAFLEVVKGESKKMTLEDLTQQFEFVISPADRVVTGAVYTPAEIREYIVDSIISRKTLTQDYKVADIACGCGGFLLTAAAKLKALTNYSYEEIFKSHIFGLDIEPYSVRRTELLLSLLALEAGEDERRYTFNLFTGDALSFNWGQNIEAFNGFSALVGNPPYVCSRNIRAATRKLLKNWSDFD